MTNWRELGFVPNSDDEDSDTALSTQDDGEESGSEAQAATKTKESGNKIAVVSPETDPTTSRPGHPTEDTIMKDTIHEGYIDIDQILGVLPNTENLAHPNPISQHEKSEIQLNGVDIGENETNKGIMVVDISNRPETPGGEEEQEDQVQLVRTREDRNSALGIFRIAQDKRIMSPQGIEIQSKIPSAHERLPSPDQATKGEAFLPNPGEDHPMLSEETWDPSAPIRQELRQSGPAIDSSSMINSSPLSSVSSTDTATPGPSSLSQKMTTLTTGFHIAVPSVHNDHQHWSAPVRNFRERKPIQKNPYLIEGERYRQTLQSRGVKPLRIQDVEKEPRNAQGVDKDSQESDYVAPPEPSHQSKRVIEDEMRLYDEENEGYSLPLSTDTPRGQVESNSSLPSETKRRKVAHTYSKRSSAPKSTQAAGSSGQRKENARYLAGVRVDGIPRDADIYDMPVNSSPQMISRNPLEQKSSNNTTRSFNKWSTDLTKSKEKLQGLFAGMDSDSESESESDLGQQHGLSQALSPGQTSLINLLSSPLHSSSETEPAVEEEEDEDEVEDVEDNGDQDEEDESQLRKFQRKTTGVLPASWWKLNKDQQVGRYSARHSARHSARSAISPVSGGIRRPGVARAKISSRPRPPDSDVFPVGHGDSDASSDEPVLLASIPAGWSTGERSAPRSNRFDFDDVVEDGGIDRMLPGIPRGDTAQIKRGRHQVNSNSSHKATGMRHGRDRISASKRGSNFTRLRQPKITDHISSKNGKSTRAKKPTAPKIGILDAAQYYRAKTSATPPLFIKIAEREVRKRRDQGRQSPSRKLFFLETETDTRDIQSVLFDWRKGTLDCVAQANSCKYRERNYENQTSGHQLRLASPQDLGEVQLHSPERLPKSPGTFKRPQPRRQSTLLNVVRRGPVSKNLLSARPQPKSHVNPVTSIAGRNVFTTHAPRFVPQAAQFEIEKPMNHTLRRLHQAPRRAATPDLILLLRNLVPRNSQLMGGDHPPEHRPHTTPAIRDDSVDSPSEIMMLPRLIPRTRRKRMPKRVDVDTVEHRQPPPQDIIPTDVEYFIPDELPLTSKPVLQGLLQYGNKYSLNFDTMPFKSGTFFNSDTFIGNGGLSRALNTAPIKEGRSKQGISFPFGDKILHWGLYQDSIAAEFEIIMNQIADSAEKAQGANDLDGVEINSCASQVYSFSQHFSDYLASFINFSDSIDLISFGKRVLQALDVCCGRVLATFGGDSYSSLKDASTRLTVQLLVFCLVFKFQIYQLASADEEVRTRLGIDKSMRRSGQYLLRQLLKCGLDDVRACYEDQRQRNKYESGIGPRYYVVEAWVVSIQTLNQAKALVQTLDQVKALDQTLDQAKALDIGFWQLFNESRPTEIERSSDIRLFERIWRIIFTSLPLHQFDHLGFTQPPNSIHPLENWSLIKILVTRPLNIYHENPEGHSGTIIDYCRILYSRCYHLISSWGWANSDLIIPTLYHFFASSQLANLKNETGYGSVGFLQDLEKTPSLAIQNSDRCFHILLKTIALGICTMKDTPRPPTKKIRNMVNRLTPNHRRKYPKEEELRVEHLNALRNHHDLLATLYWAAPPECRPPLDAIINLVDPETCHLQACNVSIRTWSNLLRFQLHSGDDIEELEPFVQWFDEIVSQILSQHNAARSEAEKIFKASKEKGNDIPEDLLEVNIRRNQKHLEDILVNAFKCLNTALSGIPVQSAIGILSKVSISNILHSHNRLSHKLVIEVLHVVRQYVYSCKRGSGLPPPTPQIDEDSQDYGDWSGIDDLIVQVEKKDAGKHLSDTVYESLRQMLSNYFGADKQPEETLLVEIIDTWVLVIGFLVQTGFKKWSIYLNTYSRESWAHLRDTEQTRKFTAYFMTKIIQAGTDTYELNKESFLSFWFKALVERESMLKFQNVYTATLLNCDPCNSIFENLPFVRDESSEQFSISQSDFSLRRLSLISSVLANMRKSYEVTRDESPVKGDSLKQEYARMLQCMMKSMKDNYQELQTKATSGVYVNFVQTVIGYLQQHTIDLVNVDAFFVNPETFPLPATDLLSFSRFLKEQLLMASRNILRAFFVGVIFPAYVECTFCEPCGWILAIPVLMALEKVIIMMREDIDSTFHPCIISVLSMLTSLLEGMRLGVRFLKPSEVLSPSVLGSLTIMFSSLSRIITLIDWLSAPEDDSINDFSEVAYDHASFLIKYSGYVRDLVENRETRVPTDVRVNQTYEGRYQAARKEYIALLKNSFTKEWCSHGGSWFVVRGAKRSEVIPPVIYGEQEGMEVLKREFTRTVETLVKVACRTEIFEMVGFSVDPNIWGYEGRGAPHSDGVRGRNRARASRTLGNLFF